MFNSTIKIKFDIQFTDWKSNISNKSNKYNL